MEVKLAGQKGIGLFAKRDISFYDCTGTKNPYEEQPLFVVNQSLSSVNQWTIQEKLNSLRPIDLQALEHVPAVQILDRNSLLGLFRATAFALSHRSVTPFYTIYALANPSCTPTIFFCVHPFAIGLFVFMECDVKAGDELCYAYTASVACMTTAERQEFFSDARHIDAFTCRCELCSAPPDHIRQLSDMRRCAMRHLLYLLKGCDLPDVPRRIPRMRRDPPGSKLRVWHN
ncbi:uncharacterized protein K489DRAFT_94143 [Dissoconium aciculare CBS 342.82]|uniref:SET domain-containing protein n=1 Tax=Dissoconium aciculare CBS 342.82 TaxID=1314786 RepID=A0A6J3LT31_9PEZI|nr:uncharacterized protein K489DRAFT_94143 [Dissoconium aciculare CBS 342.82]KAF1818444.1 hypothetical protein K489DRAFT_94143 [Dissoconium aciculare CBS 342.82]